MTGNATMLYVQVSPNAAKNALEGFRGKILRVKVAAPPVQGKANKELVAYLSDVLGISKGSVRIVKGHTLRNKAIAIDGLTEEQMLQRLSSSLPTAD